MLKKTSVKTLLKKDSGLNESAPPLFKIKVD